MVARRTSGSRSRTTRIEESGVCPYPGDESLIPPFEGCEVRERKKEKKNAGPLAAGAEFKELGAR